MNVPTVGPTGRPAEQIEHIKSVVTDSKAQGASVLFGGCRTPGLEAGNYWTPTVLACPSQEIRSVGEELFGPVCSVLQFDDEDEAVALANDSRFGLGAGLFTENLARGLRVSKAIHSGIVWVNTYRAISPLSPFGGFGQSGYGREAGIDTLYDYTRTQAVWINTASTPMSNPFVMR